MNELISTKDYPYYHYPFKHFNPVQSAVYRFKDNENNMIIGANTSAGKTIAAELLMDSTLAKGKRVVYLSPMKSLTEEKYRDWSNRYQNVNIAILTGDYVLSPDIQNQLQASQLILMTSEMMDSRTRKFNSEKNFWMKEVGLVIVDESHILTTSRGHAVETGVMRFTAITPQARVVFLSATMPNVQSLGSWLTSLNTKKTDVIFNDWRPVELQMHCMEYPVVLNKWGDPDYFANEAQKKRFAVRLVLSKPNEKFLVFVHDKRMGREIEKSLKSKGESAFFHSADLALGDRRRIERAFRDRKNGIRVLVSTSTTAWGVNLPARNVVIAGVHRGINYVDELDIIQMAGRAGRYGIDDEGYVYLIVPEGQKELWENRFRNPRPVTSVLNNHLDLSFHILGEIQANVIRTWRDVFKWYSRSLAYHQETEPLTEEDVEKIFADLIKMKMIVRKGPIIQVTNLGRVSANLYYRPRDIYCWYKNFNYLYMTGQDFDDDICLAWAIGNIPSYKSYVKSKFRDLMFRGEKFFRDANLKIDSSGNMSTILSIKAMHNCLTGKKARGDILIKMRELKYDAQRMAAALNMVDNHFAKWGKRMIWKALPLRIKKVTASC